MSEAVTIALIAAAPATLSAVFAGISTWQNRHLRNRQDGIKETVENTHACVDSMPTRISNAVTEAVVEAVQEDSTK